MSLIEFTEDADLIVIYPNTQSSTTFCMSEIHDVTLISEDTREATVLFADGGKAVISKDKIQFVE